MQRLKKRKAPKAPDSASKQNHDQFDIIIIGAGVSGLAGAMYAGRLNMKTLLIGGTPVGGTITMTDVVENYPGFKSLTGLELAEKIKEHALEYEIEFEEDEAVKVERCGASCFIVTTESGKAFHSKTLLFATGSKHRDLGVKGEKEFANRGVHSCALCDGAFYKGKIVGVAGGSDSAAKEALVLAQWASKVFIIYRGQKIRAEPVNMRRIEKKMAEGKIDIIYGTNVTEIRGDKAVTSVVLDRPYKGGTNFPVSGLFIEIGLIPLSDLAKAIGVATNDKGEITINRNSETSAAGVYAAGDVTDTRFKQAITGVAEAVAGVYSAYTYVSENNVVSARHDEPQKSA